ncbi:MAG: hypothetical protein HGA45_07625 [Chloroflexales bacterium]|nr:hypothetical protein [Chloroflexales bacterium]
MAHSIIITPRDLDILSSLALVRYLTAEHVVWLHWAPWWRAMERAVRETSAPRRKPRKAYERLQLLTQHGFLATVTRTVDRAVTVYHRLANCYTITRDGAALLAEQRGDEPQVSWYHERAKRAAVSLEHSLGIGAFYAALAAEAAYREICFQGWAADHVLCRDYDTVVVPRIVHPLPVLPDATFTLEGARYFLEVDRGTSTVEQWRKKALAYQAYQGDPRLRERYDTTQFTVLVVVPSAARMAVVARAVAGIVGGVAANYLFVLEERVNPLSIRRRWQRMERVTLEPQAERRSRTPASAQVSFAETVLWSPRVGGPA